LSIHDEWRTDRAAAKRRRDAAVPVVHRRTTPTPTPTPKPKPKPKPYGYVDGVPMDREQLEQAVRDRYPDLAAALDYWE
jgi:hypothetical protein